MGFYNSSGGDWKRAMEELIRGRESANELKYLIHRPSENEDLADLLVEKILNNFSNSIEMLSRSGDESCDEVSQNLRIKSEDSEGGDCVNSSLRKVGRGCYKRRKFLESWSKETPDLLDDGHAWRKYGQKDILKAKYPRSYFRCTHKNDQKCPATKQVQQIQDNPPKFLTTYYGNHTCTNFSRAADELYLETAAFTGASVQLLSFGTSAVGGSDRSANFKPDSVFFPASSVKQEINKEEEMSSNLSYNQSTLTSTTTTSDQYLMPFEDDDFPGVGGSVDQFEDDVLGVFGQF